MQDLTAPADERWGGLDGRLAFAPVTAMTEDFVAQAQREMAHHRAGAQRAGLTHGIAAETGAGGGSDAAGDDEGGEGQ